MEFSIALVVAHAYHLFEGDNSLLLKLTSSVTALEIGSLENPHRLEEKKEEMLRKCCTRLERSELPVEMI